MRRVFVLCAAAAAILFLVAVGCNKEGGSAGKGGSARLQTTQDSMSYAVGMDVATYVDRIGVSLDTDQIIQGMSDALEGKETRLTPEKKTEVMGELIRNMREAQSSGGEPQLPADASYAIGMDVAGYIHDQMPEDLNDQLVVQGMRDALGPDEPKLTMPVKDELVGRLQEQRRATRSAEATVRGQKYLEENAKKQGVEVTGSGLQFEVVRPGSGPYPGPNDQVTVHYEGTLVDGTVFDSSYERGEPATFPVGGVIPGWTEALQRMQVGGKYILAIPANLAYGERGAGGKIGPNETLIFTVELLSINGKPPVKLGGDEQTGGEGGGQ